MKLAIIGGGNMAQALARSLLQRTAPSVESLTVSEPDAQRRAACAALGALTTCANDAAARGAEVLILAVKPQVLPAVLDELAALPNITRTLIISIAAGRTTQFIEQRLPRAARVVRVMPNTPLMVGAGVSVLCAGRHATPADLDAAERIFSAGGITLRLPEQHFDTVTAVSGSGPAYFYLFVECLAQAGAAAGLPADIARTLACGVFTGAARLLEGGGQSPEQLRAAVTSPGGTTAAALASLQQGGLPELVRRAVDAARQRGAELAG